VTNNVFIYTQLPSGDKLPDGLYSSLAYVFDAAGNRSLEPARTTFRIDKTPATAAVTEPANEAVISTLPAVRGTAGDAGSGVARVFVALSRSTSAGSMEYWLKRDGVFSWGTTTGDLVPAVYQASSATAGTWGATSNLPSGVNLPDGQYYAAAVVYDRAGNRFASNPNSFRVGAAITDSIRVTVPANGASVTTLPYIAGRAVDGQGVARVVIALSRRNPNNVIEVWGNRSGVFGWGTTELSEPFSATVATPNATETGFTRTANLPAGEKLAPGAYFVAAQMFDAQNNSLTSAVNSFTVVASPYAGKYNVSYSTNASAGAVDSGGFVLTVANSGGASGTIQSTVFGTVTITGTVNSSGVLTGEMHSTNNANGDAFSGDLDSVGLNPMRGAGTIRDTGMNDTGPGSGETTGTWTSTRQ
jgi:hypothetical protein